MLTSGTEWGRRFGQELLTTLNLQLWWIEVYVLTSYTVSTAHDHADFPSQLTF